MKSFTPELVARVGRVINYHTGTLTPAEEEIAARAALEASGIAELTEALKRIAYLRPAGDIATAKNTRKLVEQMEVIALSALEGREA